MTALQLGLDLAQSLASAEFGMERAERHADEDYKERAWSAIVTLALGGREFTYDDVRQLVGDPPEGSHFNIAGALIRRAIKAGIVEVLGYTRSARVIGHGNRVCLLRGVA